ncbi:MAG TPA: hypothetical protein VFP65_28245 [Anaeromyxobacteraceae bacterium]|nr:hypothetical protein [Anaeromyxobacteraceae bacterium]
MSRFERAAAAVLLAAAAAPFWAGRFLPFLDLPQHLGLAAVVARLGDPTTAFARYYALDPRLTPYWGYYGAMALLARALPLELANRLLFTAYAVGLPLAAAFALASFGRDRRWAVLTVPLVFHTNLFFGFATFLLSLPLFLLALGLAERHLAAERARAGTAAALAGASVLVFLFHAQSYLLLGLCVAVLLAAHAHAHARGPAWLAARTWPFAPSLALFALWAWRSFVAADHPGAVEHTVRHRTYGGPGGLGARWEPWREVLARAPERLFGAFNDRSDAWIGLALLAVFTAALAACARGAAADLPRRRFLHAHRRGLIVLALLASYLFAPMEMNGQWYINPRHLVFAALLAPLLLARPPDGARRALLAAGAAVALAACADAGLEIRAFQAQVGPFERIAAALPPGGRVLGLPFDYGSSGPVRTWPLLHWACWQQVLAGGDVGFSFAGLPSIPVRYRPGMQAPHPYEWRPESFDWAAMGEHYDAFLTSGEPRGRGGADLRLHAVPAVRAGPFTLWTPRERLTAPPASSTEAPP